MSQSQRRTARFDNVIFGSFITPTGEMIDITDLDNGLTAVSGRVGNLDGVIQDLSFSHQDLSERVAGLDGGGVTNGQFQLLSGAHQDLSGQVSSIQNDQTTNTTFQDLSLAHQDLSGQVSSIQNDQTTNTTFQDLSLSHQDLSARVAGLGGGGGDVSREEFDNLSGAHQDLSGQVSSIQNDQVTNTTFQDLSLNNYDISSRLEFTIADLDSLSGHFATLSGDVYNISAQVITQINDFNDLSSFSYELNTVVTDLSSRVGTGTGANVYAISGKYLEITDSNSGNPPFTVNQSITNSNVQPNSLVQITWRANPLTNPPNPNPYDFVPTVTNYDINGNTLTISAMILQPTMDWPSVSGFIEYTAAIFNV